MKVATAISLILGVLIVMPIWYYLLYKILQGVQATQLMWFLFWIYIPVSLLCAILAKIVEGQKK